jgi:hypothetical protein
MRMQENRYFAVACRLQANPLPRPAVFDAGKRRAHPRFGAFRERGRPARIVGSYACFPKRAGRPRSHPERIENA